MTLPHVALGELFDISKGRKPESQLSTSAPGAMRLLQIADLRPGARPRFTEYAAGVKACCDDILIAWDGANAGTVGYGLEGYVGSTLARLRPRDSGRLFTPYVGHYLQSRFEMLNRSTTGATIPHVDGTRLRALRIPLPAIEEQRRIAAILDKADAIRRKRRRAIELADQLLRSAFLEMFGDPVRNPKGWDVKRLADTFSRPPRIGTIQPAGLEGAQAVVRVGELGSDTIPLHRCGRVTLEGRELARYRLLPGDLLLARAIGSATHLGKASILQQTDDEVVFDSHTMRLSFKPEVLQPRFFLHWLRTPGGRARFMRKAARTAVQFNVNSDQISDVEVPLPSLDDQFHYLELVGLAETTKEKMRTSSAGLHHVFESLVERAFGSPG